MSRKFCGGDVDDGNDRSIESIESIGGDWRTWQSVYRSFLIVYACAWCSGAEFGKTLDSGWWLDRLAACSAGCTTKSGHDSLIWLWRSRERNGKTKVSVTRDRAPAGCIETRTRVRQSHLAYGCDEKCTSSSSRPVSKSGMCGFFVACPYDVTRSQDTLHAANGPLLAAAVSQRNQQRV